MILVGGKFDPLHRGHVEYFQAAKRLFPGESVWCVVASHAERPLLQSAEDRVFLVRPFVDSARALGEHECMADVIRANKPRAYVKGRDWEGKLPADQRAACREVGCATVFVDTSNYSSSKLLHQYRAMTDALAVEAFERFVQNQRPAQPWKPVTDYSLEARRKIEGIHPQLIKDVFQPISVLDYGCGPGRLVTMLRELDLKVVGYEPSDQFKNLDSILRDDRYDLVICREVLEHVPVRFWLYTIRRLVGLSKCYIYITARFHPDPIHLLDARDHDDLDPTHISLLSKELLRTLFVLHGCKSRPDLEEKMDWKHQGRVLVFEVA